MKPSLTLTLLLVCLVLAPCAVAQKVGTLNVSGLKVGARGRPTWIDARVIQVIDEKQMLVGLEDSRTGKGRYSTWVMLRCPTEGIVDGQFFRGEQAWKKVAGADVLEVTGTTRYETAGGGTKTVFVLGPVK